MQKEMRKERTGNPQIVCTSLSVRRGVESPTKFSKRGAGQDLDFLRGIAGKERGDLFQEGLQFLHKK